MKRILFIFAAALGILMTAHAGTQHDAAKKPLESDSAAKQNPSVSGVMPPDSNLPIPENHYSPDGQFPHQAEYQLSPPDPATPDAFVN